MVFLFQRKFPIFTITKICLLKLVWRHRTLHMRHGMNSLMHVTLLNLKILLRTAWTQQILDGFPTSGTADLSEQAVRKEMSL